MPSDNSPIEQGRLSKTMRALLVQNALHHEDQDLLRDADAFSLESLSHYGLLTVTESQPRPEDLVAVLTTPTHARRAPAPPGPLLFLRGDGGGGSVVVPADLLADADAQVRLSAVHYFLALPLGTMSARTFHRLEEARPRVGVSGREQWMPAAKALYESLHDDLYLTLAGFNQSYAIGFDHGVQQYLPRLLRPEFAQLASVEIDLWSPHEEKVKLEQKLQSFGMMSTLSDALDAFYLAFGHLPLTSAIGLNRVVQAWASSHKLADVWTELWAWADRRSSPMPRYHVCSALLADGSIVPAGGESTLWAEISLIVHTDPDSEGTHWTEAWLLREVLACHYGYYLECLTPGIPSDRLMGMAWWLTERICELFPASPGLLKKIRETTIRNEISRSSLMNQATHPPTASSGLRYLSRYTKKTWSTSILGELANAPWLIERDVPVEEARSHIDEALVGVVLRCYPRPKGEGTQPVYGFERAIEPLAHRWCELVSPMRPEEATGMRKILSQAESLTGSNAVEEIVRALSPETADSHSRILHTLRRLVYVGLEAKDLFWKKLHEDGLWQRLLAQADDVGMALLFDSLTELAVQAGDPWRLNVSHMFAFATEKEMDPDRRKMLFGFVVFACVHTGCASALQRLMHSPLRPEFGELAAYWREQLQFSHAIFTPWAAGRVRSILPWLSLDEVAD
jgi:hypothetical protein